MHLVAQGEKLVNIPEGLSMSSLLVFIIVIQSDVGSLSTDDAVNNDIDLTDTTKRGY